MVRRARRVLLAFGLIVVFAVVATSAAVALSIGLAPDIDISPESAPPGGEITISGEGFLPGDEITVFFGGTEAIVFTDDNGSFSVSLTIDDLMPPGMHPLDISSFPGNFFLTVDYQVDEPPPPPTTTTQPPPTTTVAPTTTEAVTTTQAATTTAAPTTTAPATTTVTEAPGIVDDTRVSVSDGGGVPWWLFLIAILVAVLLGAGGMMAFNSFSVLKAGEFTDDKGNTWSICAGRTCKVEKGKQLNNKNVVRAVPRNPDEKCASGCKCVLFSWPKGEDATPSFEDEDGGWVLKSATKRYRARCVKSA